MKLKSINLNNKLGFTLIEMLVVISLIGILAALALVSFANSQKQARDTTRKSDLRQYQTAVENYASKSTTGLYPVHSTAVRTDGSLCTELALGSCAVDPKDVSPLEYKYISNAAGTTYAFWGGLETKTTTTYFIVCSNGKVGEKTTQPNATTICPL